MASSGITGDPIRRPARSVLSDETHHAIRAMVLNHQISPGVHINIDALARDLDVSQTPVREALARLEPEGLVVKQPLRGYAATELLTVEQIDDLFQFRALVEPWSAAQAAANFTDEDVTELNQEMERGRQVGDLDIGTAYAAMSEHDARFHELVSRASGSDFVHDAFVRTHCHLHLFRLFQASQSSRALATSDAEFVDDLFSLYYNSESGFLAFREHEAIAAAILARQPDQAQQLMLHHIESSRQRFSPALNALSE